MTYDVTLINLPIIHLKNDFFGNIPFMPMSVLYLTGYLENNGIDVSVIDGYGMAPTDTYSIDSKLNATGLTEDEIISNLGNADFVGISVHSGMSHSFALRLAKKIRNKLPKVNGAANAIAQGQAIIRTAVNTFIALLGS